VYSCVFLLRFVINEEEEEEDDDEEEDDKGNEVEKDSLSTPLELDELPVSGTTSFDIFPNSHRIQKKKEKALNR
jgi:hypothetical protein